jgi:excisionase family DNA binding protein
MLTIEEAATRLRVTPETVRRQVRDGRMPGAKVGAKWLIAPETVERLLSPSNVPASQRAEAIWQEMTSGNAKRHNSALRTLFAAPDDVQTLIRERSAQTAANFYVTPHGESELADWHALDGESFVDEAGDYYSDEEEAEFRAQRAAKNSSTK